jgi:hypothetical protein
MQSVLPALESLFAYLKDHPEELLRVVKNAIALRVGVPMDALRWLASRVRGKRAPKDIDISAAPPGVRVGATVDLMGTTVRASAIVIVDELKLVPRETLRIGLRLKEVSLKVLDDSETPVAALLRSGALDLSKPGNLAAYMPKRPAMLVEAKDDRVVLDLMKHPKIGSDARLQAILGVIIPIVTVRAVETDPAHLDVAFQAFPSGVGEVIGSLRRTLGRA